MATTATVLALVATIGCAKEPGSAWWNSSAPSATAAIAAIVVQPRSLNGGSSASGTVTLAQTATSATTIQLSSSDPAAMVPASVVVPAGATTGAFRVSTREVGRDALVTIKASMSGASYATTLMLWQVLPNGVWYEITPTGTARYTPDHATFTATCVASSVDARVNGGDPIFVFSATGGEPLRRGTYETASTGSGPRPSFSIFPSPLSSLCSSLNVSGRFVVEEADVLPRGGVTKFIATFEQRCDDGRASIRGEVRLTNPSPSIIIGPSSQGCTQ